MSQRAEGAAVRFDVTLSTIGTSAVVRLPEAVSKDLPSRGQVAVHGTINGVEFQTVLEPDGNSGHWMRVDDTLQHAAGIGAGDIAALGIEVTKVWPEPGVPQDLVTALAAAPPKVQNLWTEITPMARWEWVRWVNATKNPDTRTRRVEVSIAKMTSGKRRPCCLTSPRAPTRTCRRTAGSSSQGTTVPDRRSEHLAGMRQPESSGAQRTTRPDRYALADDRRGDVSRAYRRRCALAWLKHNDVL